jgi:hypothetical protein
LRVSTVARDTQQSLCCAVDHRTTATCNSALVLPALILFNRLLWVWITVLITRGEPIIDHNAGVKIKCLLIKVQYTLQPLL